MGLVRLLGFSTLSCGCVAGRYREVTSRREVTYIEEKGPSCHVATHRRNHALPMPPAARPVTRAPLARVS